MDREVIEDMNRDVEENKEMYQALADTSDEENDAPKDNWRKAEKKPIEIEYRGPYYTQYEVETIEGDYEVDEKYLEEHEGYVIIKGVQGEVYPCALDIFRETYRMVDENE